MFRIRTDSPPSPVRIRQEDRLAEQIQRISTLMSEVRRLCDAVEVMTPRYPERVRQQILDRFNEAAQRVRRVQEMTDGMRDAPAEMDGLEAAYRRLERRVEDTVADLEQAQDAQNDSESRSPVRRLSEEFEDRMDRNLMFGRMSRSYDGWRRRP